MARSCRHEKYIIQRSNKSGVSFQIWIKYKDENGKALYYQKVINAKDYSTPGEALAAAVMDRDNALQKIRLGQNVTKDLTVQMCYDKIPALFPVSLSTIERNDSIFHRGIEKYGLANKSILKLTTAELQACIAHDAKKQTQDQVNRLISVWRKIYRIAQMEGIAVTDKTLVLMPVKSKVVKIPKNVEITHEDFSRFMDALLQYQTQAIHSAHRNRVIWFLLEIMFYTGCRPCEALALNAEDIVIDPEHAYITINKEVGSTSDEHRQIVPAKTPLSIRQIPIPTVAVSLFQQLKEWSSSSPLLADFDNRPMDINYVANYIHLVSLNCGIPFNSYRLRHLFSTDMFNEKVNPRIVQDLMGHTSQAMSLYYARSSDTDRLKAIDDRSLILQNLELDN